MKSDIVPFRMIGNLYFVGNRAASCHLIDTGEGLIMIDTGYARDASKVLDSMAQLGFSIEQVRYIVLSHGHDDHSGAVPVLAELSGAKVFMNKADLLYTPGFEPDHDLKDGTVIELGNTRILVRETPGHTNGTVSFFWDIEEAGNTYRAAMFGGAGTPQLSKKWLDDWGLLYFQRGDFYRSIEKLRSEKVDVLVGNHANQNGTEAKRALLFDENGCRRAIPNPFIDPCAWPRFLDECERNMDAVIASEIRSEFVNYAHRGASAYCPENTLLSFYTGMYMQANGIETDIHRTKDGVLVLFHDDTIARVLGQPGSIEDYTLAELQTMMARGHGLEDKIVTFEDFLQHFAFRDIHFAIELKQDFVEKETADLLRKYHLEKKCVVTSFHYDNLCRMHAYAPEFKLGYLTKKIDDGLMDRLKAIGCDEFCPRADLVNAEDIAFWHHEGFRVRLWGISDETIMKQAVENGADGMTVNFPDKLRDYLAERFE